MSLSLSSSSPSSSWIQPRGDKKRLAVPPLRRLCNYHNLVQIYALVLTLWVLESRFRAAVPPSPSQGVTFAKQKQITRGSSDSVAQRQTQNEALDASICRTIVCRKFYRDFESRTQHYHPEIHYAITNSAHNSAPHWRNDVVGDLVETYLLKKQSSSTTPIRYAEIGVFKGDTLDGVVHKLPERSQVHILDRQAAVNASFHYVGALALAKEIDLVAHVVPAEWSHTDYNLDLMQLCFQVREGRLEPWDFVFLDGAHTFWNDAMAVMWIDCLLRPGGLLALDDYSWTLAKSSTSNLQRARSMYPPLLIDEPQVHMVVEGVVKGLYGYATLVPEVLFQKPEIK